MINAILKHGESLVSEHFGRFLSVGVFGAIVENVLLVGFVEGGGLDPLIGKVIAAELSIGMMFAVNERWTFANVGTIGPVQLVWRFVKSNGVRVGGIGVALGVLFVLHTWLGVWYLAANIVGIGVGFVVNYIAESLFTWQIQNGT